MLKIYGLNRAWISSINCCMYMCVVDYDKAVDIADPDSWFNALSITENSYIAYNSSIQRNIIQRWVLFERK